MMPVVAGLSASGGGGGGGASFVGWWGCFEAADRVRLE